MRMLSFKITDPLINPPVDSMRCFSDSYFIIILNEKMGCKDVTGIRKTSTVLSALNKKRIQYQTFAFALY